jgi:hypothetical protein
MLADPVVGGKMQPAAERLPITEDMARNGSIAGRPPGAKTMRRRVAVGTVVAWLAWGVPAVADDELPPLTPPVAVPSPPAEATVLDDDAPEPIPPENRPILVVPGLPTPRRMTAPPSPPAVPGPPLTPPLDLGEGPPDIAPAPLPRYSAEPLNRSGARPLTLEAVPRERLEPAPAARPRPEPTPADDPRPRTPPPRRGLLGLFLRPAPSRPQADEPIRVEPRSDPAADAALKRRVEAQVRRAVGDRVRSVDVRVVDRRIHIQARVDRFWQKRGVRRTLESLPGLAGYNTTVDVTD